MIFIVAHARFDKKNRPVHGTGGEILSYLENKKLDYLYIQHSLFAGNGSLITSRKGKKSTTICMGFRTLPFLFRLIQEFLITSYYIFSYAEKISVYLGVDPFNAVIGILFKKIGKINKVIFYTADYTKKRFTNRVLNWFYLSIDNYSAHVADFVWNVSSRIMQVRKKQGISEKKNIFVPNAPSIKNIHPLPVSKINKYDIAIVTHITEAIDFPAMFESIKRLRKKYKKLRLLIIGSGDIYEKTLREKIRNMNLVENVLFCGQLTHTNVIKLLKKCGIGIALYTNDHSWTKYGDSMKVREYFACGLPVIMNNIVSTAEDVKKNNAGYVVGKKNEKIDFAINAVLESENKYKILRENALQISKKYDFSNMMDSYLIPNI